MKKLLCFPLILLLCAVLLPCSSAAAARIHNSTERQKAAQMARNGQRDPVVAQVLDIMQAEGELIVLTVDHALLYNKKSKDLSIIEENAGLLDSMYYIDGELYLNSLHYGELYRQSADTEPYLHYHDPAWKAEKLLYTGESFVVWSRRKDTDAQQLVWYRDAKDTAAVAIDGLQISECSAYREDSVLLFCAEGLYQVFSDGRRERISHGIGAEVPEKLLDICSPHYDIDKDRLYYLRGDYANVLNKDFTEQRLAKMRLGLSPSEYRGIVAKPLENAYVTPINKEGALALKFVNIK